MSKIHFRPTLFLLGFSLVLFVGCGIKGPPTPYIETYPEKETGPVVEAVPTSPTPTPTPSPSPKGKRVKQGKKKK